MMMPRKPLALFCLYSGCALASTPSLSTFLQQPREPGDPISGYIGGASNQISHDVGDVPGNRYNGELNFDYNSNNPDELETEFNLFSLINDESLTMFSLQEAYVNKKGLMKEWNPTNHSGDNLKAGRQVLPWSSVDSTWGFGKLNNRRNFDFFTPGQEGLTGLTYENQSSSGFTWKVFGSGIYVPEMNPSLDIDKGDHTIKSRHAWGDPPASSAEVSTATSPVPIEYRVDYPKISEVVYRYSAGLNAGWESKHWAVDGFFIRKPENQISAKVRVQYAVVPQNIVKAYVTPQFYYHDVYGGNFKYKNADLEMYISGIAVRPNTFPDGDLDATEKTEIKTEKVREDYVGGGISKVNDVYGMGINYVARLSPFDRRRDTLVTDPRWNQAVNGFLMRNFSNKFQLAADLKYDMLTTDRLFMFRAGYKISKALLTTLGVNMIGTPNNGKSYWSPFTNNDALFAGMRYLF